MGWCLSLLKVLIYTIATFGYVNRIEFFTHTYLHNHLLGSFLPTSTSSAREKRRQRKGTGSMRSTILTRQILKQNWCSLKKELKSPSYSLVKFCWGIELSFRCLKTFRPWVHPDSVLSLCNSQDDNKSSSHNQWSWGLWPSKDTSEDSDHSGCQETQTGNIFWNRLYSRDAGWGLIDETSQSEVKVFFPGARNQELEAR